MDTEAWGMSQHGEGQRAWHGLRVGRESIRIAARIQNMQKESLLMVADRLYDLLPYVTDCSYCSDTAVMYLDGLPSCEKCFRSLTHLRSVWEKTRK